MFAIITTGGKQYKVTEAQKLRIEKLPTNARGENRVTFSEVLLVVNEAGEVQIGRPFLPMARVEATIINDGRARKIRVVKYKAKTRYKRVAGHRQPFTEVRIDKIIA